MFAMQVINRVDHVGLKKELTNVYHGEEALRAAFAAHEMFETLTSRQSTEASRHLFCANYPQTHLSSQSVGGLIVRLLGSAAGTRPETRMLAYDAAEKMSHVIAEDTGVEGKPHNELYANFAGAITGNDQWRLPEFVIPPVKEFAQYVQTSRTKDALEVAIATTFASEVFNTGEYTHFSTLVGKWLTDDIGLDRHDANHAAIYVMIHSGDTELDHALNAYQALKLFHGATGTKLDPAAVGDVFRTYLGNVAITYSAITEAMESSQLGLQNLLSRNGVSPKIAEYRV